MSLSRNDAVLHGITGCGLGALVGLLLGLSVSPVVATVAAALVAAIAAWSAQPPTQANADPNQVAHDARIASWRLAGFAWGCIVALILGIGLRTYQVLGPSAASRQQTWQTMGYSEDQARDMAALQSGVPAIPEASLAEKKKAWRALGFNEQQVLRLLAVHILAEARVPSAGQTQSPATPLSYTVPGLFTTAGNTGQLALLNPDDFENMEEAREAMRTSGPAWQAFADALEPLPTKQQQSLFAALYHLLQAQATQTP